jgi:hypothetical protein
MPALVDLHVGDVGVPIQITVVDANGDPIPDLTSADSIELLMQKPIDGSFVVRDAECVLADGVSVVRYTLADGDLDQAGRWRLQLRIEIGGDVKYTDVAKVKVYANLPLEV